MRYSLNKSFEFHIPKASEGEKLLARGFAENGLSLFIQAIQTTIKESVEHHAALQTAALKSLLQLTIEFVKNSIDANATKILIKINYDSKNNRTSIFISDNGHGFKESAQLGSCIWQDALLKPSQKASAKTDETGVKLVYGGAGLGNAIAAHFNEKYGYAASGKGLVKRNRYSADNLIIGAQIILESHNIACFKNIEMGDGEYLREMRRDLMLYLCEKFGVSKENQSLLRDNFFEHFLKNFKAENDLSMLEKNFLAWIEEEKRNHEEEKRRELAATQISPLSSATSFASGNYSLFGSSDSSPLQAGKTGMRKKPSLSLPASSPAVLTVLPPPPPFTAKS